MKLPVDNQKIIPLEIVIGVISVTSSNTAFGVELAAKEHKSLTLVDSLDVAADKGSATWTIHLHIFRLVGMTTHAKLLRNWR